MNKSEDQLISCFPNPTDSKLFFKNLENKTYAYSLMDLTGKMVKTGSYHPEIGFLDFSAENEGIYILKMTVNGQFTYRKLVLRK